jgi:hypothetical protein
MFISIFRILKGRLGFALLKFKKKQSFKMRNNQDEIVDQIKVNGFTVVPDFYTSQECTELRKEVDTLIETRKKEKSLWTDEAKSDNRCFAAEDGGELIKKYFSNAFLLDVASSYFDGKLICSNTLAARINYTKGNIGSGQGWHRDSNNFQFKAMVYLSDVEIKDGPFQIIKGSHKFANILKDTVTMSVDGITTRFTNKQVERVIEKSPENYTVLTAKAGTLVFVDTSSIHTGMTLSEGGERYALFNYYYPSYDDIEKRKETFKNAGKSHEYS